MISLVIDQPQPRVLYLQKIMNFMKPGVFYLQKWWISWKCALFIKKTTSFIKKSILHTYKKIKPQIWAFIKNSIFGTFRDPCRYLPKGHQPGHKGLWDFFLFPISYYILPSICAVCTVLLCAKNSPFCNHFEPNSSLKVVPGLRELY